MCSAANVGFGSACGEMCVAAVNSMLQARSPSRASLLGDLSWCMQIECTAATATVGLMMVADLISVSYACRFLAPSSHLSASCS